MSQPTPLQRMETVIGNSVSEAEMSAAFLAYNAVIDKIPARSYLTTADYQAAQRVAHDHALRAALTAAAQERAHLALDDVRANDAMQKIGVMPIYGATEDTKEDLVQATTEPAEASRDHPIVAAVAAERERCAKIADSSAINIGAGFGWGAWTEEEHDFGVNVAKTIAKNIRATEDISQSDWNREIAAPAPRKGE